MLITFIGTKMNRMNKIVAIVVVALLSGCATIFNGTVTAIDVNTPVKADFKILDKKGKVISSGTTPSRVYLSNRAGYFEPARYTIKYSRYNIPLQSDTVAGTLSPWYLGNLLHGGFVGMLIIDPLTGGMWELYKVSRLR